MARPDGGERARTFVALYPSPAQRGALEALLAGLGSAPGLRTTPPGQAHLTLAFLGDVPRERLDEVAARAGAAAARHAPFALGYAGIGAFPEGGAPRVVWLGVGTGREALRALAADVRGGLAGAGFAVDDRPFRPHLTLARVRPRARGGGAGEALDALRERAADGTGGVDPVREIAVVTSRLGAGGATHARHATCRLAGTEGSAPT